MRSLWSMYVAEQTCTSEQGLGYIAKLCPASLATARFPGSADRHPHHQKSHCLVACNHVACAPAHHNSNRCIAWEGISMMLDRNLVISFSVENFLVLEEELLYSVTEITLSL